MKRFICFLMVLSVPALVFMNLWQVYQYRSAEEKVSELEQLQRKYVEENKMMLANIAIASSPERIEEIAVDDFGLAKIQPGRIIQIVKRGD